MGARLVTLVLMRWANIGDAEFRLLVRMAHTAMDERTPTAPAATYFGGHELLAATLRSEGGNEATVLRRVRKAITKLVELGAIERVGGAGGGRNQVYRLTLEGERREVGAPQGNGQQVPDVPTGEGPEVPTEEVPVVPDSRDQEYPPRNNEEPIEELYEDQDEDLRTDLTDSRARCPEHPYLEGGERDDGTLRCPLCRRKARDPTRPSFTVIEGGAA